MSFKQINTENVPTLLQFGLLYMFSSTPGDAKSDYTYLEPNEGIKTISSFLAINPAKKQGFGSNLTGITAPPYQAQEVDSSYQSNKEYDSKFLNFYRIFIIL